MPTILMFLWSQASHQTLRFILEIQIIKSTNVQYAHFHGTDDGAIKYDGQNPGPMFLKGAEVIAAQL